MNLTPDNRSKDYVPFDFSGNLSSINTDCKKLLSSNEIFNGNSCSKTGNQSSGKVTPILLGSDKLKLELEALPEENDMFSTPRNETSSIYTKSAHNS